MSSNKEKTQNEWIELYLQQMTEKEKKAFAIAKEHLDTSFHLGKSNGFREWKKNQTKDSS